MHIFIALAPSAALDYGALILQQKRHSSREPFLQNLHCTVTLAQPFESPIALKWNVQMKLGMYGMKSIFRMAKP